MKLRGTMLRPGVSKNGRLYTAENIRKAHNRLVERLKDPTRPVAMLTHHDAKDDSTRIVGKVTSVSLGEGSALNYTADLAGTPNAATLQDLVEGKYLQNVSIRGWWAAEPETVTVNGQKVETAPDIEIDGLDFTKNPGVTGATVQTDNGTAEETAGRALITETVSVTPFTETVESKYADPGYLGGVKRYPLDTLTEAHQANHRLTENADQYTPRQLKRVRGRIKTALRTLGETMPHLNETDTRVGDVTEYVGDTGTAGFSITAFNGPLQVSVSAYDGIDPADLAGVATAAMTAAIGAVHALDPDDDGDIDTGTTDSSAPVADSSQETQPKEKAAVAETQAPEATTETAEPGTETVKPVAESAPLTREDILALIKEATTAPDKSNVAEAAEPKAEDVAKLVEQAVEAKKAEWTEAAKTQFIAEQRKANAFTRKGLVEVSPGGKPLHEMSDDELRAEAVKYAVPAVIAGARTE